MVNCKLSSHVYYVTNTPQFCKSWLIQ